MLLINPRAADILAVAERLAAAAGSVMPSPSKQEEQTLKKLQREQLAKQLRERYGNY